MTPLDAFKLHSHLRLHFTKEGYDVRKYLWKNATEASFQKSKAKYKLTKLCEKYSTDHLKEYFIANFVSGDEQGGVFNVDGHDVLLEWRRRVQAMNYLLKQDMLFLKGVVGESGLDSLWDCRDGHPPILTNLLGKRISLETLVILNEFCGFQTLLDERLADDIIWKPISKMITKYQPFFDFKKKGFAVIIEGIF